MSGISLANIDLGSVMKGAGQLAKDIRAAITGKEILDPTKLAELETKAQEIEAAMLQAQVDINKIEAASSSIFVAGWRPFIGWISGLGLFYHYIGYNLINWVAALFDYKVVPPALETEGLISIVFALLGLGTLRTWEKIKGVEGNR